ncbi:3-isopropylmalate dehydratase [Variovorax sp. dw_308]|uniref:LeuD/DmdB family oxidoreductase small subunit n=1 Tax=Variovorax sp. dw_308 TaxID=2721546 RepID=UPI001C4934D6|nr:3-isopropylmalate dehydratase [Variovorax sp. dw_308]
MSKRIGPGSTHRVWRLGADIDTDVLAPGHAMKHGIDKIAAYCLESVRPEFASAVRGGDVIVAGPNFGIGSSREQAAAVLVKLGVSAVIAPSYSGLYFRNAINLGLLLLTCAQVDVIQEGDRIRIDTGEPAVIAPNGMRLACEPVPAFLMDMVRAGGLMNQLRQRAGKEPLDV